MNLMKYFSRKRDTAFSKIAISRCASCNKMFIKGNELVFISAIGRTGTEIHMITDKDMSHLDDTTFTLNSLSITNKTYVACEFNSYVVRLKHNG